VPAAGPRECAGYEDTLLGLPDHQRTSLDWPGRHRYPIFVFGKLSVRAVRSHPLGKWAVQHLDERAEQQVPAEEDEHIEPVVCR
jgi:hypothetical protein